LSQSSTAGQVPSANHHHHNILPWLLPEVCLPQKLCYHQHSSNGLEGTLIWKLLNKHQLEKCFEATDLMQMEKKTDMCVPSNVVYKTPNSVLLSTSVNLWNAQNIVKLSHHILKTSVPQFAHRYQVTDRQKDTWLPQKEFFIMLWRTPIWGRDLMKPQFSTNFFIYLWFI
jgi:hypothetical protein